MTWSGYARNRVSRSRIWVAALVGNSEAMIQKHYAHIDADAKLLKELADRVAKAG
jgi:hypothetical protein